MQTMKQDWIDKTYAVVFSGGGARGAYEMGVWKALNELGITIEAVAGTSIGSINGALMVQKDFVRALNVWNELSPEMVFDTDLSGIEKYRDVSNIKKLLEENIDEKKIRDSDLRYALVTYNLSDLNDETVFIEQIQDGKLIDYLMASANHPIFKRYKIDGKLYIDGGVYNNLPAKPLVEAGYKNLIVVDVRDPLAMTSQKFDKEGTFLLEIKPKNNLGGVMNFSKESIQENLTYGYYDTFKLFGKYLGTEYYLTSDESELSEFQFSSSDFRYLREDDFFSKLFKNRRVMLELFRYINEMVHSRNYMSIFGKDFYIACIEICADTLGINRCAEYSVPELCEILLREFEDIIQKEKYLEENIKNRISEKLMNKNFSLENEDKKLVLAAMLGSIGMISNHYGLLARISPKVIISYLTANIMLNRLDFRQSD